MTQPITSLFQRAAGIPPEKTRQALRLALVGLAAAGFILVSSITVAFDDVFGLNIISSIEVGSIAPRNLVAAERTTYISEILTNQARQEARDSVGMVYDPPDPSIVRGQTLLAQQILEYIDNIRRDAFATDEQAIADIRHITALTLSQPEDEPTILTMLRMDDEIWRAVQDEILTVLPRIMRDPIRPDELQSVRDQLPSQVSIRFNPAESQVIIAIVEDLLRANTLENLAATEEARRLAEEAVAPVERSFERGQIIVFESEPINELNYEALQKLGLLTPDETRGQNILRALIASIVVMVVTGLYIVRFRPELVTHDARFLTTLAVIFLLMLVAARFLGINANIYLFPTAALALLFVAIAGAQIAIIAMLGLALLLGLMAGDSLQVATLVAAGGIIGTLVLRHPERLNSFFLAGGLVAVVNAAVIAIFKLTTLSSVDPDAIGIIIMVLLNGALVTPMAAIGAMWVVTTLFNLPTALRLLDLSQPSKPLLQRLLREAPGTYQHSLQVANLAEQAAEAIGADANLTHVAALYHDIGKMLNAPFFTENQGDFPNPHDTLNDPHRSADIIISHITEGDELARQYRLPQRLRDFIREHHGTTQVYVFYQQAIIQAGGDESAVDIADFTYPGPRPRSKETAILLIADSCEAAARAIKPQNKQDIAELVHNIIEAKRRDGQLDNANLTLKDLKTIERVITEMLQAVYHPRINYQDAVEKSRGRARKDTSTRIPAVPRTPPRIPTVVAGEGRGRTGETAAVTPPAADKTGQVPVVDAGLRTLELPRVRPPEEEEAPLPDVPRLPRAGKRGDNNGHPTETTPEVQSPDDEEKKK